jgi:hypothetical protein
MGNTKQLADANIIRPIIILLLVIMHSFTMYAGSWTMPEGIENVRAYFWVGKIASSFRLEMFVFISGYLFAFQVYELKKKYLLKDIAFNKFKRLIIPSIFFSLLYVILFRPLSFKWVYDIFNGAGHLWYLPMLFWCFIGSYFLMKIKMDEKLKLLGLLVLSMLSPIVSPLPLRIGTAFYYLFFFYWAIYIYIEREREGIIRKYAKAKMIVIISVVFFILFIASTLLIERIKSFETNVLLQKVFYSLIAKDLRIFYATIGLFAMYISINYLAEIKKIKIPQWLINSNKLCYGIYIYHQFILMILYYKTSLPQMCGTYWLPIIGCITTIIISIILTKLTLQFRFGKFLIR